MSTEYKIRFNVPQGYDPSKLFSTLPNPIHKSVGEIYNYTIEQDGFYFVDHLIDEAVAAIAFRRFVDEALRCRECVEVIEL